MNLVISGQYRDERHHDDRDGRGDREGGGGPLFQRQDPDAMDGEREREREREREGQREHGESENRPSMRFESFEYNHQSHSDMRGGGEIDRESRDSKPQVFDYHHQSNPPPPWGIDPRHGPPPRPIPIPPPGFGPPPHRFPPSEWGPPPRGGGGGGPPGPPGSRGPPGPPHGLHHGPPPPIRPPSPDLPPPIPYYDLPAGITCLLVPVRKFHQFQSTLFYYYSF